MNARTVLVLSVVVTMIGLGIIGREALAGGGNPSGIEYQMTGGLSNPVVREANASSSRVLR